MTRMISIGALAVALLAGGGWWISQQGASSTGSTQFDLPGAANAQTADAEASDVEIVEMVKGNPDATVEVIEYASYTCPHCASFHQNVLPQLTEDYIDSGKIKFVYREVYFDKFGVWGSMIARCGGEEKFFGITDMLYKTQQEWVRAGSEGEIADELRKIGLLAGLEQDTLESCLTDSEQARALVAWFQTNAEEHNIRSTPSFVINGELYSNMPYNEFQDILDTALAE